MKIIIEVPDLSEKYIPDADVMVAGSSWMLDVLKNYLEEFGKFYFPLCRYMNLKLKTFEDVNYF